MNQVLVEICLRVRDIDATLDFYTELFDFEVASRREFPNDKFDLIYLDIDCLYLQNLALILLCTLVFLLTSENFQVMEIL